MKQCRANVRITLGVMVVLLPASLAAGTDKNVWLVLTRDMFVDALEPLRTHRQQQGFQAVISTAAPADAIATHKSRLRYILLVGDEQKTYAGPTDPNIEIIKAAWRMPSCYYQIICWHNGEKDCFVSDAVWGDLDGDGVMDIPVGRLPVRTTEQLQVIIDKILLYECRGPRLSDLMFPLWTGKARYGDIIDRFTTTLLLENLEALAPEWCQPWVISANDTHALCGWPFDQPELFAQKVQEGGALCAFMGHGWRDHVYSMTFEDTSISFSTDHARQYWAKGDPASPWMLIACYSGNFAAAEDCLAETVLKLPGGPVAAIAGSGETHPLTNLYCGQALLRQMNQEHRRLGDLWRAVQRQTAQTRIPLAELLLEQIEGQFKEPEGIEKVRSDHQLVYNLLGDPAMPLYLPGRLHGRIDRTAEGWRWQVNKPADADGLLVDWREQEVHFSPGLKLTDPSDARRQLRQANARFAFERLGQCAADEEWTGCVNKPGVLRFVAIGKDRLYTAAIVLTPDIKAD
ncbi:MAG: hypothetical protein JW709_13155 [Sedimentisphaerales bacterium]|nr:hypothetical protein [Sedimentisphaerales bacterium]